MADTRTQDMTGDTAPGIADLLYMVQDPAGTPADRKVAMGDLLGFVDGLTELASTPDATDLFIVIDAGVPKKLQKSNLPSGGADLLEVQVFS